jgi:hypothetical protein
MKKITVCYTLNCMSNMKEKIVIKLCLCHKYIPIYGHNYDYTEGLQINDNPMRRFTNFRKNKNMLIYEFGNTTLKIFRTKNRKMYINVISDNINKFFNVTKGYNHKEEYFPPPCRDDYHMEILFQFFRDIKEEYFPQLPQYDYYHINVPFEFLKNIW